MTDGSNLLVAAPENKGAGRITGSSGKENPDLVESLRPGPFKAATYGRLTGKPGICISALGPGMQNFCFISRVIS
jgi:acetolactate synthase-1/2/3 large subunit